MEDDGAGRNRQMRFMITAMAAEMERDQIRERTLNGLRAAQAQGRHNGRPAASTRTRSSVTAIARQLRVGRSTPDPALDL